MAFNEFSYNNTGPGEHADYLKALRAALDAGEISVSEYLQKGMPVAKEGYQAAAQLGGGGSASATNASRIRQLFAQAGFANQQTADDPFGVRINLPSSYQEQVRESLLPAGLTPEQKAAYLKDIPQDIQLGTDQYSLEREGLRQKIQQEETLGKQKTARQQMLERLSGVLNTNANNQFDRSIADISEDANASGVFRSTGYGNALAKYRSQLEQDVATQLGSASIASENADINTLADIESNLQGFQTSGLNRKFSLDDFETQKRYAMDLANASKPQTPGKSSGQRWAQGIQLGIGAAGIAAAPFTGGASLGATAGAGAKAGGQR